MTVTTLDPKSALIVVDLQKGLVSLPAIHPVTEIVRQAGALAAAFRRRKLPVVFVTVAGGAPGRTEQPRRAGEPSPGWTDLVPELNRQPEDHVVTKRTWGAFTDTDLATHLKALGVTQVVLTGVATSIGVELTARQAYGLGFNVSLAVDAMTDLNREAHDNSIARIFPKLGETGTTQDIIALLDGGTI